MDDDDLQSATLARAAGAAAAATGAGLACVSLGLACLVMARPGGLVACVWLVRMLLGFALFGMGWELARGEAEHVEFVILVGATGASGALGLGCVVGWDRPAGWFCLGFAPPFAAITVLAHAGRADYLAWRARRESESAGEG